MWGNADICWIWLRWRREFGEVGLGEVVAFVEEGGSGDFGDGVGVAVAHVEGGGVAAFAEAFEGCGCFYEVEIRELYCFAVGTIQE